MKINLVEKSVAEVDADLLVLFVSASWEKEIKILGKSASLVLSASLLEDFTGGKDQSLFVDTPDLKSKRVLLYGIGGKRERSVYQTQNLIGKCFKLVKKTKRKKIAVYLPLDLFASNSFKTLPQAIYLSDYEFNKYKSEKEKGISQVFLIAPKGLTDKYKKGIKEAKTIAAAVCFARDLVNEPAEVTTPSYLALVARRITRENKRVKVKVFDKAEIKKMGMNLLLAVGQGSKHNPLFIRLSYKPEGTARKKIVLAGKGITFDTGGLSLKNSKAMENMKIDMAGAACVLSLFSQIEKIKPQVEVVGLIAACENMPSEKALRPGDIIKAYGGKTVEVVNTDAEGRLTLADTLSFAVLKEKPDYLIDLATLTGAIISALGEDIAGIFTNNEILGEKVKAAAENSGEMVWPMPLFAEYQQLIKGKVSDLRNVSSRKYGGAITASLFLKEFVGETPWVHLDIAGPVWAEKEIPICKEGATGFGVATLIGLLTSF